MENKILYLTLKKQWFDLINSGVKTEEYRDIKPYWEKSLKIRLTTLWNLEMAIKRMLQR